MRVVVTAGAVLLLVGFAGIAPAGAAPTADNESLSIRAVYPNPVADRDTGEFVVLESTQPTRLSNWTLADDDRRVALPNRTVEQRLVLSPAPNRTRNLTSGPVARLPSGLALANSGERLRLRHGGTVVDSLAYRDAPEGELARPAGEGIAWHPLGATEFPVVTATDSEARVFVLPDGSGVPAETLGTAEDRILLAGYTLTSRRVVDQLSAAASRGVEVRVLVDDSPVGGMTQRQARTLDRLAATRATVSVIGGERARYRYHHAKYAVVDDRALVTTENWKPSGTGGHASRGWGVVVASPEIVRGLVETFQADAGWRDVSPWRDFRQGRAFEPAQSPPANGTYPGRFAPQRVPVDRVELVRAPDNAQRRVVAALDNASHSITVQQVSLGSPNQPFVQATLRAARRGVDVRVLLSSAWYVEEDNRAMVDWLNERAAQENLPLEARLAAPNGRFEKIHAKGVIIDEERVLVGSINWNNNSVRENREVALLLEGDAVGEYYARVFAADWQGGRWRLPVGLAVAVVVGALLAGFLGRRIEFEEEGVRPG